MSVSWTYPFPEAARRGWAFVPAPWLDAFGRWDAHWYLDVASRGYELRGPLGSVQSNVAFFPLYPWTVRALHALAARAAARRPGSSPRMAVSNAALLRGALAPLAARPGPRRRGDGDADRALRAPLPGRVRPLGALPRGALPAPLGGEPLGGDEGAARGSPACSGSCWRSPGPGGVLVAVPLAWIALERGGRRLPALAAAALPGLGLALHAAHLWRVTGDPLALFHAQAAWGRALADALADAPRTPGTSTPGWGRSRRPALALVAALGGLAAPAAGDPGAGDLGARVARPGAALRDAPLRRSGSPR